MKSIDATGLEVLDRHECLELLSAASLGRVALSMGALPAVLPVSFCLMDDQIVFYTGAGSKLAAALEETVVAFEVDDFDSFTGDGWSVNVVGRASVHCGFLHRLRLDLADVKPLVPGPLPFVVSIDTTIVTGRRLLAHRAPTTEVTGDEADRRDGR